MRKNCWMCEKFSQLRKVVDEHFVICVQNVSCANDLCDLFTIAFNALVFLDFEKRHACRWPIVQYETAHPPSPLSPFLSRSILISRPVSRKLNHCTIGENDGSLCHKFMRRKILTIRPRHIEIV